MESKECGCNNNNSRRDFLKTSAAVGCGALACGCGSGTLEQEETVKLLSPDGELVEVAKSQIRLASRPEGASRIEARKGIPGRKFVMVVDLGKCNNARKCITACQNYHYQPEDKEWLQIKLLKDNDNSAPYWFPKQCFHCDNPPCVKVCPIDATYKRDDGIVLIDNQRCIGCKFCMVACPYSTRVFNWDEPDQPEEVHEHPYSPESGTPAEIGTVAKCDFCPDLVREGKLPNCVSACPNGVFYFGDENEDIVTNGTDTVRFKQLLKDRAGYRYMEVLGTEPRVYYLPPSDRIFPLERGFEDLPEEVKSRYKDVDI